MEEKIKTHLVRLLEDKNDVFPDEILQFWVRHYGATVDKTILDKTGKEWTVDQVLSVDMKEDVSPTPVSWRNNISPAALDYSAPYLESVLSNWEEHDKLIAIAGIRSHEKSNYDLLVISFLEGHSPKVSIWVHNESFGYDEPYLIEVADSFEIFQTDWT